MSSLNGGSDASNSASGTIGLSSDAVVGGCGLGSAAGAPWPGFGTLPICANALAGTSALLANSTIRNGTPEIALAPLSIASMRNHATTKPANAKKVHAIIQIFGTAAYAYARFNVNRAQNATECSHSALSRRTSVGISVGQSRLTILLGPKLVGGAAFV